MARICNPCKITQGKTANDNTLRWYTYSYDALNRITKGISSNGKFDLGTTANSITYDKNGNILSLYRKGHIVANPDIVNATDYGAMDNLAYTYNSGNKLLSVTDSSLKTTGFNDGNTTGNDYTYDANEGGTLRKHPVGVFSERARWRNGKWMPTKALHQLPTII